jgi:hypothetical protein
MAHRTPPPFRKERERMGLPPRARFWEGREDGRKACYTLMFPPTLPRNRLPQLCRFCKAGHHGPTLTPLRGLFLSHSYPTAYAVGCILPPLRG